MTNPEPPEYRDESRSPWPTWPLVLRTSPAHAEGGARRYEVAVRRFVGDEHGHVRAMEIAEVRVSRDADGRRHITHVGEALEIPCELALLAIGFDGVEHMALLGGLGCSPTAAVRCRVDRAGRPTPQAYSSVATPTAARRSSFGPSPRAAVPRTRSTPT